MTQLQLRAPCPQIAESVHQISQNLGFKPQNLPWGDPAPNSDNGYLIPAKNTIIIIKGLA